MGVPLFTVGFIAAASTVVGILVSIPAGILSDIVGRRRVILMAGCVFATAPFLYLLITEPWQLVFVRVYHGLATAILGPVAMAAVADTYEKGRGEKMGWYSSATMVGRFLAPLAGGMLIFGDDFRWVYVADGIAGALALLAAIRLPLATNASGLARGAFKEQFFKYRTELGFILRHGGILGTSGIDAVQYFAYGAIETFLPIFLLEVRGYQEWRIGLLFTAQIVAAALTKPVMGRLSDRYGRVPMIVAGLILGAVSTAFLVVSNDYILTMVIVAAFGLGLATVTASTSALVADLSRAQGRGGAMGVLSSIMDVGQSTGPIIMGIVVASFSYKPAFASVAAFMFVVSIVYGLTMRRTSSRMAVTR